MSSFYTPDRVLRQFGFQQVLWTLYDDEPAKALMTDDLGVALIYAWDHKTMIRPVAETAHTTCLADAYLDFYKEKINPKYHLFDKFRLAVLQGVYKSAMIGHRCEAVQDEHNIVSDPSGAWLKSDWYDRRRALFINKAAKERRRERLAKCRASITQPNKKK